MWARVWLFVQSGVHSCEFQCCLYRVTKQSASKFDTLYGSYIELGRVRALLLVPAIGFGVPGKVIVSRMLDNFPAVRTNSNEGLDGSNLTRLLNPCDVISIFVFYSLSLELFIFF